MVYTGRLVDERKRVRVRVRGRDCVLGCGPAALAAVGCAIVVRRVGRALHRCRGGRRRGERRPAHERAVLAEHAVLGDVMDAEEHRVVHDVARGEEECVCAHLLEQRLGRALRDVEPARGVPVAVEACIAAARGRVPAGPFRSPLE